MSDPKLTCFKKEVVVSYPSLAKYLPGFWADSSLLEIPQTDFLPVEIRVAKFALSTDKGGSVLIVFVFDLQKKNRLHLVDRATLSLIVKHFNTNGFTSGDTIMILVGKDGSRKQTQLELPFMSVPTRKLLVLDFDGGTNLADFLLRIIVDVDKAEARLLSLSNKSRLDLTSLPTSEKRIRLGKEDGDAKERIIFANQLLQIQGISEKAAQALASEYGRSSNLMARVGSENSLEEISFVSAKGETRRLNVRVRNMIRAIFSGNPDPDNLLN